MTGYTDQLVHDLENPGRYALTDAFTACTHAYEYGSY